ncbi:MAG: sodium/proline symporter [Gammaproteobacteria bacterium]|nr:sodium/proline symporter [Gammaproteobacteria bacterium]MCW8923094.1 sodium/proline symporter [Gammaproteobacteria bacterium]
MIISFLLFLFLFVIIGVSSARKSRGTKQDYYLASSSISPALVGLSAVATNNSGYMFIGVIGYTYATGLSSVWLMIGWILGDFLASTFVHHRLRKATELSGEVSYAGVLSNWYNNGKQDNLQNLIGLISLIFLLAYASAQLVAGSKALQVLFEWPAWAGAVIGAILVAVYCIAGGIRASIWTDAAQSVVMIAAMAILLFIASSSLGGINASITQMSAVEGFLDCFPKNLALPGLAGGVLFAISWAFAGFSVIGQPHIMVRFMTLQSNQKMNQARLWYYLWFTSFYVMATGVGMLSRIYLANDGSFDAELALPTMALELLSPVFVGLVLAGIFAATMSTADSLVLSCSAAITHDLLPHKVENTFLLKATTLLITLAALSWALVNSQSVFSLVILAWSGLASAFAPLLIVLSLGGKPDQKLSMLAVISGLSAAMIWRYLGWHSAVYEGMAGIITGLIILSLPLLTNRKQLRASSQQV